MIKIAFVINGKARKMKSFISEIKRVFDETFFRF
jgi:hypothetical protein